MLHAEPHAQPARRVAIITGSRAEFGLLRPVMRAVHEHPGLALQIIAAGSHMANAGETYRDVKQFAKELGTEVADAVPMQIDGRTGRQADAEAVGAGVSRFTRAFMRLDPAWVVVLGDRIEAFAAAAAASVGGWGLAHLHGGDRAEGIADEAMRHAITKLAHLHLPATEESAQRLLRMGEEPGRVHLVGSPAIDELANVPEASDAALEEMGLTGAGPDVLLLMHPVGRSEEDERLAAEQVIEGLSRWWSAWARGGKGPRVLALQPNLDAGREGVRLAVEAYAARAEGVRLVSHLPRARFIGVLKRLARAGGVMLGNSSAGLIEAAHLRVRVVDIGARQRGRERAGNVVSCPREEAAAVAAALREAERLKLSGVVSPYGDGRAGPRAAELLARLDPRDGGMLRKCGTY